MFLDQLLVKVPHVQIEVRVAVQAQDLFCLRLRHPPAARCSPGNSSGPHGGGAVIVNFATQTSTVLMPQQRMYMEMSIQAQGPRQTYSFFAAGDVQDACGDWQKISHIQAGTCHKVGTDTVNGRSAVEYEATNSSGDVTRVWLDAKVRFPLKWQGKNNGGELRNLQDGSQPASLFEAPAGYTKMDMGAMMQPHQQQ